MAAFDIPCETDQKACEVARQLAEPEPVAEIWQATRLVGRVGDERRSGDPNVNRSMLACGA